MTPTPDRVLIFDTTLRDGEQAPGCSMTLPEKLRVAKALAELGVDVIEAGFPAASRGDWESVNAVARDVHGRSSPAWRAARARTSSWRPERCSRHRVIDCTCFWRPAPSIASTSSTWRRNRSSGTPPRA